MRDRIFRMFNPGGPSEDPVEKRRAQLRRAQQQVLFLISIHQRQPLTSQRRTYRARKERYARCLEKELVQSRTSEAKLVVKCERLGAAVRGLTGLLAQYGIDIPTDMSLDYTEGDDYDEPVADLPTFPFTPVSPPDDTQPQFAGAIDKVQSPVHFHHDDQSSSAQFNQHDTSARRRQAHRLFEQVSDLSVRDPYDQNCDVQPFSVSATALASSRQTTNRVCDLDMDTVGMEFVLTLERPCQGHIAGDPNKPQELCGHALTTSAQLLCVCSPTWLEHPKAPPTPSYQNVTATVLHRLLKLSPAVSSDDELTPVQAWNSLQLQPRFGASDVQSLWRLAESLRKAVKCHGFGAVVEKTTFESLMFEILLLGQNT